MTLKENVFLSRIMQTTGGATPLMYACQQCRENEVLDILTKQPFKVKDRDRTLKTPLHYCAENSSTSCAEAILKIAPELVNAQDENGYCTLHLAVIAGNKPLIKLLILKGADINIYDNEGHSAVHWAIVSSEKEALEMIIRAGANPSTPDIHGGYPLHYAVQICGSNCDYIVNPADTVKVVETLLNFGVNVNVKDKDGRQPILWAASAGSAEAIIHLISAGACVEAADKDGLTALHCAASRGHTSTLDTLITLCGANVDVIDGNGCSALFYAVTLGHADATELLLHLGAEPNRQDRKGRTPAHCGAAKGQLETLRILQKHGGNLWLRNVKGDFPLHEAVASGRKDLVLWLLSQNPEAVNVANNDGRCLIHIASMYNNTEMVKLLLDAKSLVNPVMRTSKGILMTPLNVALSKGHRSCGKFLQLHGGVPFSKVSKVETTVYAVRISPSDDMIKSGEASIRTITPSPDKGSSNKTSTDVHVQSADKKKVYRRRKKKKTTLTVEKNSDSDSDETPHELKVKTAESRRSGKSSQYSDDENDEKKLHLERKREKVVNVNERVLVQGVTEGREEIVEEVLQSRKAADRRIALKQLQKNKSFSETKNVSDLSPEDFPPLMQTVEQLDTVIMEPETDFSKNISEVNVIVSDTLQTDVKSEEVPQSGNAVSTKSIDKEEIQIQENSHDDGIGKDKTVENKGKESPTETKKKSPRGVGPKRSNGSKKEEKATKSSGSKSSTDEISVRKADKSGRAPGSKGSTAGSSHKKGDSSPKPGTATSSDGVLEGSDNSKKSSNSRISRSVVSSKKDEKSSPPPEVKEPVVEVPMEKQEKLQEQPPEEEALKEIETNPTVEHVLENENNVSQPEVAQPEVTPPEVAPPEEDPSEEASKVPAEEGEVKNPDAEVAETENEEPLKAPDVLVQLQPPTPTPEVDPSASENDTPIDKPSSDPLEESNSLPIKENSPQILTEENTSGVAVEDSEKKDKANTDEQPKEIAESVVVSEVVVEESATNVMSEPKVEILQMESEAVEGPETTDAIPDQDVPESKTEEVPPDVSPLDEIPIIATDVEVSKNLLLIAAEEVALEDVEMESESRSDPPQGNHEEDAENTDELLAVSQSEVVNDEKAQGDEENDFIEIQDSSEGDDRVEEARSINVNLTKKEEGDESAEKEEDPATDKSTNEASRDQPLKETNEWMNSGKRHYRPARVPRLCRRHREFQDDISQISVTQLVQNTIRKYHMERGIFYQLLELKRLQIRAGRANEQVLVKRLVDEYERSIAFIGMKHFSGLYKFREFEKFLYDQLKSLNSNHSLIIPEMKSYDDIDALSGILKKTRYKIVSEVPQPDKFCTCITQRCHHSACAYTSVPCSTYISNLRRHKPHKPRKECFLPRIDQSPTFKSEKLKQDDQPATLELIQGNEKRVITLPQNFPDKSKRYYVTFTIKSSPSLREEGFFEDTKDYFKHRHAKSV